MLWPGPSIHVVKHLHVQYLHTHISAVILRTYIHPLQLVNQLSIFLNCAVPENIQTPLTEVFFCFNSPPIWKFQSCFILSLKNFGILDSHASPFGISNDPPQGGYGCFLEMPILSYAHNYVVSFLRELCFLCRDRYSYRGPFG